jgi:hypothetical protein
MGPPRAGLMRDTLGSLAVLGAVVLVAFGLPLIDRALPASRPLETVDAAPFTVGSGVTMVPPGQSRVDLVKTRPGRDRGTALFLIGGVRVAVVVGPYRGSLDDAFHRLHHKLERTGDASVGPAGPVRTTQGVAGVQGQYVSAGRPGTYAVFVADGVGVEVTAGGPGTELGALAPQLDLAVRSVRFGPPGRGS